MSPPVALHLVAHCHLQLHSLHSMLPLLLHLHSLHCSDSSFVLHSKLQPPLHLLPEPLLLYFEPQPLVELGLELAAVVLLVVSPQQLHTVDIQDIQHKVADNTHVHWLEMQQAQWEWYHNIAHNTQSVDRFLLMHS